MRRLWRWLRRVTGAQERARQAAVNRLTGKAFELATARERAVTVPIRYAQERRGEEQD